MEVLMEEEEGFNPIKFVLQFLANYGWYLVGAAVVVMYLIQKLMPGYKRWQQAREDAEHHKDPDKFRARAEAVQRARERQQQQMEAAAQRAREAEAERQERKRQENLQRLQRHGEGSGRRLGDGYLPLSGAPDASSYRPPKRSACARGGCGR